MSAKSYTPGTASTADTRTAACIVELREIIEGLEKQETEQKAGLTEHDHELMNEVETAYKTYTLPQLEDLYQRVESEQSNNARQLSDTQVKLGEARTELENLEPATDTDTSDHTVSIEEIVSRFPGLFNENDRTLVEVMVEMERSDELTEEEKKSSRVEFGKSLSISARVHSTWGGVDCPPRADFSGVSMSFSSRCTVCGSFECHETMHNLDYSSQGKSQIPYRSLGEGVVPNLTAHFPFT